MELSPGRLRLGAAAFVAAWFLVPELRSWIPAWLPFLVLAALELNFVVGGLRERARPRPRRGRAPQEADIAEFGGEEWLEPTFEELEAAEDVVVPKRGWSRRSLVEAAVVLAAAALVLFVFVPDSGWRTLDEDEQRRTEARLSAEAGRIAGKPVRLRCDAEGEEVGVVQHADGVAEVGGDDAFLTPELCYRLHRLAFDGDEGGFSPTARAVTVLAHEAWHLRGVSDEGVVNCYAFQSGVELGRRLGLSESTAARMMRQQLAENAVLARSAPAYLVPPECRNGGPLDLDPASDRFP